MNNLPGPEVAEVDPRHVGIPYLEALLAGYGETIVDECDQDPIDASIDDGFGLTVVRLPAGSEVDADYRDGRRVRQVVTDRDVYVVIATDEGHHLADSASDAYLMAADFADLFAHCYPDIDQATRDFWISVEARLRTRTTQ